VKYIAEIDKAWQAKGRFMPGMDDDATHTERGG